MAGISTNQGHSYPRPCKGAVKKRKKLFTARKRGKRRKQVHEKTGRNAKNPVKYLPVSNDKW